MLNFKGPRFPIEVILVCIRWYAAYPLFRAIERSAAEDIDLFEMAPEKLSGMVVLRGDALSMDALSAYMRRLGEQDGMQRVHLTHQKLKQRDGLMVVSFEIAAQFTVVR